MNIEKSNELHSFGTEILEKISFVLWSLRHAKKANSEHFRSIALKAINDVRILLDTWQDMITSD